MPAVETFLSEGERSRKRRKKLIITIILAVIGIHLAGGIVAGVIVVAKYIFPAPANFEVKKDIRLPAKQREHKMNMAAFDAMTPKPTFNDRMQSLRPSTFALPELPKMPMDQMLPLDPAEIVSDQVSSLTGTAGQGAGGEGSGGLGGTGTGMSFFGIQSTGKRVLLLFDVSGSVVNKANKAGVPLSKIQEETANLITKLPISARFGIIQFTRNYKPFNKELLPATDQNRQAALSWIKTEWEESGKMAAGGGVVANSRGLVGVLELAAKMQPDVIFLISDGSFQWNPNNDPGYGGDIPWDEVEKVTKGSLQGPEGCKLHFIGFEMKPDNKRDMGSIVRKTGGKLREIK
jgi:hypothetical protein